MSLSTFSCFVKRVIFFSIFLWFLFSLVKAIQFTFYTPLRYFYLLSHARRICRIGTVNNDNRSIAGPDNLLITANNVHTTKVCTCWNRAISRGKGCGILSAEFIIYSLVFLLFYFFIFHPFADLFDLRFRGSHTRAVKQK